MLRFASCSVALLLVTSVPHDTALVPTETRAPVLARGSRAARTLEERFADVANIKDFGATGDGRTNDTDAIRAAYDSLGANGGTIVFPAGTYRFNLTIAKGGIS